MAATLTRRSFLQASALATGAPLLKSAENPSSGWIDAHVHLWTPDTQSYPLASGFTTADLQPPSFTPEEYFAHSQAAGVSRTVLIQMSFYHFDNSYMLEMLKQHEGVFSGVAIVDPERADLAAEMKRLRASGVRGFRIYSSAEKAAGWAQSASMQKFWALGAELDMAMCLLADPDALPHVDKMCQQHPRTRVVVDHFSRIGMKGPATEEQMTALCRLAQHPQVYLKTSAFYALGKKAPPYSDLAPMIQRLVKEFTARRLMWASDCPYQVQAPHDYASSLNLIRTGLDFLSEAERTALLRSTAEEVFFRA